MWVFVAKRAVWQGFASCTIPAPAVIDSFPCGLQASCHDLPVAWLWDMASPITAAWLFFFLPSESNWKLARRRET